MASVLIKGTAVRDTLGSIRGRVGEAGLSSMLASLSQKDRSALEEPILITGWYSLDAYIALVEISIRVQDGGDPRPFAARAKKVLEAELTGVYRHFGQLGAPEALVKRIAAAHQTYFQGTSVDVQSTTERSARIRYHGFTGRHRLMQGAIEAFYTTALELCGATEVVVEFTTLISNASPFAEVEIRWEPPPSA
jgi:hypothetical protein